MRFIQAAEDSYHQHPMGRSAALWEAAGRPAYQSHFLIEINKATGVPTLVGYG